MVEKEVTAMIAPIAIRLPREWLPPWIAHEGWFGRKVRRLLGPPRDPSLA